MKLLRFKELKTVVGLSRTSVWRLERRGEFPRRRQISRNVVGWREDEVFAWLDSRPCSDTGSAPSAAAACIQPEQ